MTRVKHIPLDGTVRNLSMRQLKNQRLHSKIFKDQEQAVFSKEMLQAMGLLQVEKKPAVQVVQEEKLGLSPYEKALCPFCLSYRQVSQFLISTKKGFDLGKGRCSECGNGVQWKTLRFMKVCSPEQYAVWVWDYKKSGFFKKINFAKWRVALSNMQTRERDNFGARFWARYSELKKELEDMEKLSEESEEERERIAELADGYEEDQKKQEVQG